MRTILLTIFLLSFANFCFSQKTKADTVKAKTSLLDTVVFDFPKVQKVPEFQGGDTAMMQFISKNIVYPQIAAKNGVAGTVYLTFFVERDGTLSNIEVLKGVNVDLSKSKTEKETEIVENAAKTLSDEAIRVVKLMPPYNPGIRYGTEVRVKFLLPIRYALQ